MSSQRKRPNKQPTKSASVQSVKTGGTASRPLTVPGTKPSVSARPTVASPTAATKATTGASPVAAATKSAVKTASTKPEPRATAKAAYAPAVATAARPQMGTAAHLVRAFTGAFPFAGLEYVIFLGVIETNMAFALPVGLIALGLACGIVFLTQQRRDDAEPQMLAWVRQWLGDPPVVAGSVALLGAALLAFARWNATGAHGFSILAGVALAAALLLLFVAHYRRNVLAAS